MKVLISGGAGFIGSAVVRYILNHTNDIVINVDKLTYAGNLSNIENYKDNDRHIFVKADICDKEHLKYIFDEYQPDAVMHLAAESHVDRSIDEPIDFIQTNIIGTYNLLEVSRLYWKNLAEDKKATFRFHHISTDEVYGDLEKTDELFTEETPYSPSSPYSASKAASDHLVRAWFRTYGFPTIVTNCSNNYGPYHFPEKLIPLVIINALSGKKLPVYGNGKQIRDWLFVDDHAKALYLVLNKSSPGKTYNIGGNNEKENIQVVTEICKILDKLVPDKPSGIHSYSELIEFVKDRPGHDVRYAIDATKIKTELGWSPSETFESGILKTVEWFLGNRKWWSEILDSKYKTERLGIDK